VALSKSQTALRVSQRMHASSARLRGRTGIVEILSGSMVPNSKMYVLRKKTTAFRENLLNN